MIFKLLVLLVVVAHQSQADFLADITKLAESETHTKVFREDETGYDLHKDIFYYQDADVKEAFKRSNYASTQTTLGGQAVSLLGNKAPQAVHPFAIAQRSFVTFGTNSDRWDVKNDQESGYQYFGLYHGEGSEFVVNKLRAHFLRDLANGISEQLALLDRTAESDAEGHEDTVKQLHANLRASILSIISQKDAEIRKSMYNSDDSSAAAVVVVLSKAYVITINVGGGQVLTYDSDSSIDVLASGNLKNVFGAKNSRRTALKPQIEFKRRVELDDEDEEKELQFVLIESPTVAGLVPNVEAVKVILNQVVSLRGDAGREQDLYLNSVRGLMEVIESRINMFKKLFSSNSRDASVILIGLETDYNNIH